jgi:hypothetical protein
MDVLEGNMTLEELAQKNKDDPEAAGVVAIYEEQGESTPT